MGFRVACSGVKFSDEVGWIGRSIRAIINMDPSRSCEGWSRPEPVTIVTTSTPNRDKQSTYYRGPNN